MLPIAPTTDGFDPHRTKGGRSPSSDWPDLRRPYAGDRRARAGKDYDGQNAGRSFGMGFSAHSIYTRPDAGRYYRHRNSPGGRERPSARPDLPSWPGLCELDPGRRNQSHTAEDPGGFARSDA